MAPLGYGRFSAAPVRCLVLPSRRPIRCMCLASTLPRRALDVIIVGSGIGGLTAASALLETGARVRVFESRRMQDALTGPGGIQIQANAEKVLRLLRSNWVAPSSPNRNGANSSINGGSGYSLSDAIYAVGGPIMSGGFRNHQGSYLYYADMNSVGLTDVQSNGLSISRRSLQRILFAALPPGVVSFERSFASFTAPPAGSPGKVQVTFEDGGVERCDVLVAADGIRSKVRGQLAGGPAPLLYSGTVCWRGLLPLSRLRGGAEGFLQAINHDSWAEYWGSGRRIGFFTIRAEAVPDAAAPGGLRVLEEPQLAWYAFDKRPPGWRAAPGSDEAAALRELFADFAAPVRDLLAAVQPSEVHVASMYQQPLPTAPWGSGRVTLLGDAAHAMLPTLGQGGCMAVEDALELANELGAAIATASSGAGAVASSSDGSKDMATDLAADAAAVQLLESALRRYEASRAPRTARVSEQSMQIAQLAMADTPLSVWARNTLYRLTPKWAGDKQFQYLFKDYLPAWREGVRLGRAEAAAVEVGSGAATK